MSHEQMLQRQMSLGITRSSQHRLSQEHLRKSPNGSLFVQANLDQMKLKAKDEDQLRKEQISKIFPDQDISQISIFKSKRDFNELVTIIDQRFNRTMLSLWIVLFIFGLLDFVICILYMISSNTPIFINIAFDVQEVKLDITHWEEEKVMGKAISVQFLNLARAFLMSGWYVLLFFLFRQKKVSVIDRVQFIFFFILALYLLILVGEIFIGISIVDQVLDFSTIVGQLDALSIDRVKFEKKLIVAISVGYFIYLLFFLMGNLIFFCFIIKFNSSMKSFHYFLATYRQTPRSRFIRKYKPALDPLYEENSAFEKSILSSQVGFLDTSHRHEFSSNNQPGTRNISIVIGTSKIIDFDVITETFLEHNDGQPDANSGHNLSESQRFNNERFASEKQRNVHFDGEQYQRSFAEGDDPEKKLKVQSIDMRTNHNTYMPPLMLFQNQLISSSGQETNSIRNDKSMERLADKSYDNVPEVQLLNSVQSIGNDASLRFATGAKLISSGVQTATFMNNTRISENPAVESKADSKGTFISQVSGDK